MAKRARKSDPSAARPDGDVLVGLGADLRVGRACEVYKAISGQAGGGSVILDASEVAKVDAAGVQTLLAATVALRTAGRTWRWHNPSLALKNAAQILALDGALELE